MAATSSAGKYKRDNNTKNEVQDFGGSAIHVLRRQSIPDLLDLSNDMQPRVPHQHDRAIQRRRRTSTPVLSGISMETISKADGREGIADTAVFEAALTLCRIQEKPCYVANSVMGNSKKVLHDRPGSVLDSGASKEGPVSHPEDADVPQRMIPDGTESILKARDRLAGPARVRSRGLKMSPMDAFKAAEIRRYRFFRLVAMQLRRSSQHAA
ncbi:hypothetical protein LZ30DRAFT_773448 [Colletotrichum cereale]|nr:hypothetical protein LZ30DRAFT_773448 [Colletotrichum cereale]